MAEGRGATKKENESENDRPKVSSKVYIAAVLVLALVMIGILGAISFFSEPERVDLKDLEEHEGEEVVCKGVVVGVDMEQYSTTIMLYQDGTVTRINVEERTDKAQVNDRIKARGEVYKSGSNYAVQVVGKNSIEVLGEVEPEEVYPAELADNLNEYVLLDGVVTGISKESWGGGTARIIGIPSIESEGNWSADCMIKFSDCPNDLNSTDRVTVYGVVRESDDEAYLYVYDRKAVKIEKGYWTPKNLTLGMLSELVIESSDEFTDFEVKVSGYLKYEPSGYGSITLTDHPSQGDYSLRVETGDTESVPEMHKGDLIYVQGTVGYDREGLRYILEAQWAEVGEYYGIWNVSLEELVDDYYLYENTRVQVGGHLEYVENNTYLYDEDCRIRTNAPPANWHLGVESQYNGWLKFDEEELFYYLDMSEP
jgi:hypothetical protein